MKKIIAIMIMTVMTLGVFATEWHDADKDYLTATIASNTAPVWQKVHCVVHLNYLNNPEKFDTFEKLIDECRKANRECGVTQEDKDVEEVGRIVLVLQDYFKQYNNQAFEYVSDNHVVLSWYLNGVMNFTAKEQWFGIVNCLIDHFYHPRDIVNAVNKALSIDARISKADKIELYSMVYEKLYIRIADEANLPAEQKLCTKAVTRLAMKLKALGVDIK